MSWLDYFNPGQALPTQYQDRGQIMGAINAGLGRQAPTIDQSQSNQFRQGQQQQIAQLQGIASGQQQGAGELAAQRQTQNALGAQQAIARMARGPNSALAYRDAANNAAGVGMAGAGQAQQAAMGDQMNAQGILQSALGQGRSQDYQNAYANQQGQFQQQNIGQGYLNSLTGMDANQLQAQQNAVNARNQQVGGLLTQGGQLLGGALSLFSDERLKTDIADADEDVDALLDALDAKRYRYKDERHGTGSRVGIMAQDLERSRAGRDIVRETPEGKALDVNAALSAALAGAARLNERVRKLEAAA